MIRPRSAFFVLPLALAVLSACNREQIQSVRITKPTVAPATAAPLPPGHPPLGGAPMMDSGVVAPAATAPGAPGLQWVLPKGWAETKGTGMRFATLKPPTDGVDVSVISLAGPAGGELANVNRWRGQIGLPPIDEAALAKAKTTVKSPAGPVAVYEFTNSGNRMIVGLLTAADGNTWFIKLTGAEAPAQQAKTDFMKLIGTLSLG